MHLPSSPRRAPVSFALVALATGAFALTSLGWVGLVGLFNYVPLEMVGRRVVLGEAGADWWRFVTPTLIHFGWLHLVFNCLWIWEFGQRIEHVLGSFNLFALYLVAAACSNSVQYFWQGPSIFGGMSGVVYAFLGFIWAAQLLRPGWLLPPPPAVLGFMLVWLAIGFLGPLDFLGVGAVANGAHLGGLVTGFILGAILATFERLGRNSL